MANFSRWLYWFVHETPAPRSPRRQPRRGPDRDEHYLAWIRTLRCCCGCGRRPCHAAHTGKDGGMSMKASDYSCVPLYWKCHRKYDSGRRRFEEQHGIRMSAIVRDLNERWARRAGKAAA